MRFMTWAASATSLLLACAPAGPATPAESASPPGLSRQLDVRLVSDEADAVLDILEERAGGRHAAAADWDRLFTSEGYVRLKRRERAMGVAFTDSAFRAFVLTPGLAARREALRRTLQAWRGIDVDAAARRALAYLPAGTTIRARMYPEIKPASNSFVFDTDTDPAIFFYLDPGRTTAKTANTLSHELHHIGTASACAEPQDSTLPQALRDARTWASGFDEGRAMLAAAGGPDVDPHATSSADERAIWERNLTRAPEDVRRLTGFFGDILDGAITGDALRRRGFGFINTEDAPQGAFYTVGWLMSAVVEKELGRATLVASLCDPVRFMEDYDEAAARANRRGGGPVVRGAPAALPLWPETLLERMIVPPDHRGHERPATTVKRLTGPERGRAAQAASAAQATALARATARHRLDRAAARRSSPAPDGSESLP